MRRKKVAASFGSEQYLRSINLVYDADKPENISHFHPTKKCTSLIRALRGERPDKCFIIIAPYGSGKSLTATYFLHLTENRKESREVLQTINSRMAAIDPDLADKVENTRFTKSRGLVFAMSGYNPDLPQALHEAIIESCNRQKMGKQDRPFKNIKPVTLRDVLKTLTYIFDNAERWNVDKISILWDEFGRHIEGIVNAGKPEALHDIQTLAEFVSRSQSDKVKFTFGLFLHQTLLNYAGNTSQSVKKEWKKIEGRFELHQYIEDSKEIYNLISEVVNLRRDKEILPPDIKEKVKALQALGLFQDFSRTEAERLFVNSYPLEPLTLFLLPRVSARVAQNERTIFTFLNRLNLEEPAGPDVLFNYFSDAMQADSSIGGTHKQWLETQSAISKVQDAEDVKLLKTVALLSLGVHGERSRTSKELLSLALQGYGKANGIKQRIEKLLDRKLLLYRKNSDSLSLWHGTDFDLRGRLEDEKLRRAGNFDVIEFLTREMPPEPWKPLDYNTEYQITRFFQGSYILGRDFLKRFQDKTFFSLPNPTDDGIVYYLIAESKEELQSLTKQLDNWDGDSRIVFCVPQEYKDISTAALEVACLEEIAKDNVLLNEDPLLRPELNQMLGDAQLQLQMILDANFFPHDGGPNWVSAGIKRSCTSSKALRRFLSSIASRVYSKTPKIRNEMFVRRKLRRNLVNSRKKLVFAVLDNTGRKDFALQGYTPDVSLYRTFFLHTGLYKSLSEDDFDWRFAYPEELNDPGLRDVWAIVRDFFTSPSELEKNPSALFDTLQNPPYGVRDALLPVLFAAGLKAFPSSLTITRNGEYLPDILPTTIEELVEKPEIYAIKVVQLSKDQRRYLEKVIDLFSIDGRKVSVRENDLLRRAFDVITYWKTTIPPSALETKKISETSKALQECFRNETNPHILLFSRIPEICGLFRDDKEAVLATIKAAKEELEEVKNRFYQAGFESLLHALEITAESEKQQLEAVREWAKLFSDTESSKLNSSLQKGFIARILMGYSSKEALLDSLGSLLIGKTVGKWDDGTAVIFDKEVHSIVSQIEEAVLLEGDEVDQYAKKIILGLVGKKVLSLKNRLEKTLGRKEAREFLEKLLKEG